MNVLNAVAIDEGDLDPRAITTIRLSSANDRLGVQLYDTTLRGRPIVAIQSIPTILSSSTLSKRLQPGMVVLDYTHAKDVVARIASGPYPVELRFYNLAAGGDAFNDMGTPMVTAQDALQLAQRTETTSTQQIIPQQPQLQESYAMTKLQTVPIDACAIKSRRGDVLELQYEAAAVVTIQSADGQQTQQQRVVYDSSSSRGTGQPYQMVLGSGDVLPGVDLGLYDMCPGEIRQLQIPPRLAYGAKGNKIFRIQPNTPLEWTVELVSIDGIIRRNNNQISRDEREGRALY